MQPHRWKLPEKDPEQAQPQVEKTQVTSSRVTPMDPMDDIQPPTRKCISPTSVHFQDSLSNKSDRLLKSKVQGNRLTGLSHQFNTDFLCDEKRNDRDLHRSWNDREQLSNTTLKTTSMTTIQVIPTTQKEAHLLSGPSELQLPDASEVQHRSGNQDKNTADSQKQKKLSFKSHLLIMMKETLSGTILSINFHLTLSTRQNQILPLFLILYFRKKGGNCRRCTCTCTHTGDSRRMTTHSRIKKVNTPELWEASQCI